MFGGIPSRRNNSRLSLLFGAAAANDAGSSYSDASSYTFYSTITSSRSNSFSTIRPTTATTPRATTGSMVRMASTNRDDDERSDGLTTDDDAEELGMENIYCEWTLEDDQLLYNNRNESIPKLATLLGRGLRGVQARVDKLTDIDTPAYQRLFSTNKKTTEDSTTTPNKTTTDNDSNKKLTPAKEIMRRIRWDLNLVPDDFTVFYYDRVEDAIKSAPFDARNDSVAGREESFVFAIPEHRIMVRTLCASCAIRCCF